MKSFKKVSLAALFCLGALVLAGCGGNNDNPSGDVTTGSAAPTTSGDTPVTTSTSGEHQHSYQFSSFEWTETPGAYTAKAVYTCSAGDSTVKYDATVTKTAHVDATCSATGSNTWKASYDGHEDTKVETIAKAPHTPNAYGFCSTCGEYAGATANGLTYEVSKAADQLDYFRIAVEPEREYSWALDVQYVSNAFFRSTTGDLLPFYGDDPALVPANSDGYIYFVLTFASAGTFHATLTLLPICDHASLNIYGFCNSCGRYRGDTILPYSDPVSLAGLTGKRFLRYYLYDYDGCNTVVMSNAKDELNNQVELNAYYQDLEGVMHPLEEYAYGEIFVEKGQYILKRESGNARYLYLVVNYTGTGTVSGTLALDDLNESSYGYDHVDGYGLFHGDYTPVGFDHNFESAHIFANTTSGIFTYALNVTGLTSGKCYKVTPSSIDIELDQVYQIDGHTVYPMMSGDGYFEFAPIGATTTATLVFKSNSAITTSDSVLIEEGHFANPEDNYKGFYCDHHMMPVWAGEPLALVNGASLINVSMAAGESKYYRLQATAGHDVNLVFSQNENIVSKLYYYNGNAMTEVPVTGDTLFESLPLGIQVGNETDVYYFVSLKNNNESTYNFTFGFEEDHHYNDALFCNIDGTYIPQGYDIEQSDVDSHNTLNFNVPLNGRKPLRFPIVAGHEFRVKFSNSNSFLVTQDNQVRFFYRGEYNDAISIDVSRTDSDSLYVYAPINSEDDYIYMVVAPTYNPVNSAGLQIYDMGHDYSMEFGNCACGAYSGHTLALDVPITNSTLSNGEKVFFRVPFNEDYVSYSINYPMEQDNIDFDVAYIDQDGILRGLTWDYYQDDTINVRTGTSDGVSVTQNINPKDGYLYFYLLCEQASYDPTGLVWDNMSNPH